MRILANSVKSPNLKFQLNNTKKAVINIDEDQDSDSDNGPKNHKSVSGIFHAKNDFTMV